MRVAISTLTACGLALAACSTTTPETTASTAAGDPAASVKTASADPSIASDDNPACRMRGHNGMTRPGDNVPLRMTVQNTGRWCFSGYGFSGLSARGSSLVNKPSNGEVRLMMRDSIVMFGYRPAPGYAGSDSFLIAMPTGSGYNINLALSVMVQPPATP